MSKIQFEQLSDDELIVSIPAETPMELVNQLTKSLLSKGLIEDTDLSTLTYRRFVKPQDGANQLADKLIKSLESMTKADEYTKLKWAQAAQNKLAERNKFRVGIGLKPITLEQMKNPTAPVVPPIPNTTVTAPQSGPVTLTGGPNKLLGEVGENVTPKQYSSTANQYKKNEDGDLEDDDDVEKSNYKGAGISQYNQADNVRRKANNTTDSISIGPNKNVKAYSTKPGQLSNKEQASLTARIQNAANKKQPVKQWSPEQIAAENIKRGLKKGWGEHLPFPSAEEEILRLAKATVSSGEEVAANQLANLMMNKQMLGKDVHPAIAAMMAPPPPQPTDEQMFGHLAVSEEMAKKAEQQWSGTINNWLIEATKPISQRFSSEEEEVAYWSNIKVNDRDDGNSGY